MDQAGIDLDGAAAAAVATRVTLTIRRATPADAAALAEIGARTFHDTFAADNRPDDMAAHLATTFGECRSKPPS